MKNDIKTRSSWNSGLFYSPDCPRKRGKKDASTKLKEMLNLPDHLPKQPTLISYVQFRESYNPTLETLETVKTRNSEIKIRDYINGLFGEIPVKRVDEVLRFSNALYALKTHTYAKSRTLAENRFDVVIRGRAFRRTVKQRETTPPNYETVIIPRGCVYRFYFYDIAKRKTITRTLSTNRARKNPTRSVKTLTKTIKLLLPLNKIIQLKPKKTLIYNAEIKPEYVIKTPIYPIKAFKTHATHETTINYKQLARAEKRISKKWFKLLLESLKDESRIIELPPHLKRLRRRIVKSDSTTQITLRKTRPIISRVNTVIEYNHTLKTEAIAEIATIRARKHKSK